MDPTDLSQKIREVMKYFYKDLYKEVYRDELLKDLDDNLHLETDQKIIEEVILIWCMSYFLIPIIAYFKDKEELTTIIETISDFTGIESKMILHQHELTTRETVDNVFGSYNYLFLLINKIGDNKILTEKDPYIANLLSFYANKLIKNGEDGLNAVLST